MWSTQKADLSFRTITVWHLFLNLYLSNMISERATPKEAIRIAVCAVESRVEGNRGVYGGMLPTRKIREHEVG
jgi:hypothetical protein